MNSVTKEFLAKISKNHDAPCLSLYQPTHRSPPDNQQDPIRFGNLLKQLEASLQKIHPNSEGQALLVPFHKLADDKGFWTHTLDGIGVFASPGFFETVTFPMVVPELAIVADTFHCKPLWRFLQTVDRFQILSLSRQEVKLFEGNRHGVEELDLLPGVPRTISAALGKELSEPHQTVASYGGVGGGSSSMHHGHGGKADEIDSDTERFFRTIDQAVLETYSQISNLPLILAALPEYHSLFQRISRNPFLVAEGVKINPESLSLQDLADQAWQAFRPQHQLRLKNLADKFSEAKAHGSGSEDLDQVVKAAAAGKVATLMIEANRRIAGKIDAAGMAQQGELDDPRIDDILDDLGKLVIKNGGQVLVIPSDEMATKTGIAATFRY